MEDDTAQNQAQSSAQAVDWIVLSANALGVSVVVLAVLYAKAGGIAQQVASTAGSGAIF